MSEFSEKLSNWILASGYNVYQLAKVAALDRTTLQKTVKGQRLPSFEYVKDICRYIKLSKKQEEELHRLYQIEKLGSGVVEAWDEINRTLVDIQGLREMKRSNNYLNIHFDQASFESLNEKIVQTYSSETETVKAIICMIEQEVMEEDSPEIYMDVSWATQYALSQLLQCEKETVCHQLVNLRDAKHSGRGVSENFRILHQILPYAFTLHREYDIRYAYVAGGAEDLKYNLWPHYIVTHQHVFLGSKDKYRALVLSHKQIAQFYRMELKQKLLEYRPLFVYQGLSGEGIRRYREMPEHSEPHLTFEAHPCIGLLIPEEMKDELKKDPKTGADAEAYFDMPKKYGNQYINLFSMRGMKNFARTGHLPDIFDKYFQVESIEMRKNMFEIFHQHLLKGTRCFRMIKEEQEINCEGATIELFGKVLSI